MAKRKTVKDILACRKNNKKIVCLTASTAPIASIIDKYCDIALVGDSLGMTIYGMESTLSVTLEMMINHGRAVVAATNKALVVVDMPFASYQESKELAFRNAAKILAETNCQAVKLEGGVELSDTISFLVDRGVPVLAHIGLMPQHVNRYGGYKYQGQDKIETDKIINDMKAVENSGAFAVVLEGVASHIADKICQEAKIPVIGIGASANCDGQILVTEDMIGIFATTAKFVKKYADAKGLIEKAVSDFSNEVETGKFPSDENYY